MTHGSGGVLFDIQHFSISNGPGVRTTVFFKGCNLHCAWCHNPESRDRKCDILLDSRKCIGCGACAQVCEAHAHQFVNGEREYLREVCEGCGSCVRECYAGALKSAGYRASVEEVMREVLRDKGLYEVSKGGVTFSGGEPMLQPDFLASLLKRCADEGIHATVDTAGSVSNGVFQRIAPLTDLFLFDVKAISEDVHRAYTGVGNRLILENLDWLLENAKSVWVRLPLISGVNDSDEECERYMSYFRDRPVEQIDILPYHRFGEGKFTMLGLDAPMFSAPSRDHIEKLCKGLEASGRLVQVAAS